jgi:MFS family permease
MVNRAMPSAFHVVGNNIYQNTRHLIGGICAGALVGCALGLTRHVFPVVFPHMQDSLGFSSGKMGVLATSYFLAYMFCAYFWGHRSDRVGPRPIIVFCLLISALSLALLGAFDHFVLLVIFSMIIGVGAGGLYVPAISSLVKIFSAEQRGKAISIFFLGEGSSAIALGLLVPFVVLQLSWRWVWWASGGLCLLFVPVIKILLHDNGPNDQNPDVENTKNLFPKLNNFAFIKIPNIKHISVVYFLHALARGAFVTFVVVYLIEKGISYRTAGGAFSLTGIGFIPGSFLAGYLADRFRSYVLLGLVLAELAAVATIVFSTHIVPIYIAVVIMGCCLTGIPTVVSTITAKVASKVSYGQVLGWLTFCLGLGIMISPTLVGFVAEISGTLAATQIFAMASLFIATLVCIFMEQGLIRMRASSGPRIS